MSRAFGSWRFGLSHSAAEGNGSGVIHPQDGMAIRLGILQRMVASVVTTHEYKEDSRVPGWISVDLWLSWWSVEMMLCRASLKHQKKGTGPQHHSMVGNAALTTTSPRHSEPSLVSLF